MAALNPGLADSELFGRYQIIKRLGQGGMGSVYLAQDTHLQRSVALKVPDFGQHEPPEARRRFLEEARTAATLDHPYLCPVYDAGEVEGQPYLTMAYIEGQSLAALIGEQGWPERQVAALVGKLAVALQEAHRQKVVHRDLKPANVMIKKTVGRREPVIVDFGLARRDNPQEQRLTKSGQLVGTLGYMAPEQIRGDLNEIGPACGIYALGVILYELLTGRLPFSGSGLGVAAQILTQAPLPPSAHRSDIDPALEAICLKAMATTIADRYTSMAELAAALTGFLQSPSASTAPTAPSDSPGSAPPVAHEQPQRAGSSSLVGQFLAQLAGSEESPSPVPALGLGASEAPLLKRRRPMWPMIVAAGVLGVSLLFVMIYVGTDKGPVKDIAAPPTHSVKADGDRDEATDKGQIKDTEPRLTHTVKADGDGSAAARTEYVSQNGAEKSATTKNLVETNPWPDALSATGQVLPVRDRFLAMSHDCRLLAVATRTDLLIVEAPSASRVFKMKGQPPAKGGEAAYIWAVAFSPDGMRIAISLNGLPATIWEIASGKEVCRTSLLPGTGLAYSLDGKRLAVAGRQNKVVGVGDTATGQKLFDLGPHSALTDCVNFSPDGKWLASGSGVDRGEDWYDWAVKFGTGTDLIIWDPATGAASVLEGHPKRVNAATFGPDSKRLASASSDGTVKVWGVTTKNRLVTFDKHQTPVRFVRFSPDGRLIASAGQEKLVRIWNAETGEEVKLLTGLRGNPEFLQFSPEGRWIYSGARSTLKAWKTPTSPELGETPVFVAGADNRPAGPAVEKPSAPAKPAETGKPSQRVENRQTPADDRAFFLSEMQHSDPKPNRPGNVAANGTLGKFKEKIRIKGQESPHGLYLHPIAQAHSEVTYMIGGKWDQFEGSVAICPLTDRKNYDGPPLKFEVLGDNTVLWTSKEATKFDEPETFSIGVQYVKQLRLRVKCPGRSDLARAVWVEPRLRPPRLVLAEEFNTPQIGLPTEINAPQSLDHGQSNGAFFFYAAGGNWFIGNRPIRSDGTCEVVGRVLSDHPSKAAAWLAIVSGLCDLRLMSSVKEISDVPRRGKDLIIVAAVDGLLHFRIFDGVGKLVVDTDEKGQAARARQIEDLRTELAGLWAPHKLDLIEKGRVITAVTSIVGRTLSGKPAGRGFGVKINVKGEVFLVPNPNAA